MKDKNTYYGNEAFEAIYNRMKEEHAPQLISFTPTDEKTLADRISAVLRPVYEKAISALFKGNKRSDAELDADAISRGMGSSTFVTDVKRRQDNIAAEGARELESEYGTQLADQLYKAMDAERDKQLDVEKFNAQQRSEAMTQAFEMAKVLYEAYLAEKSRHSGGGGGGSQPKQTSEGEMKNSLAQAVASARGNLAANPNGPAFYAKGDRTTVGRVVNSDLPKYVKLRKQMNGEYRAKQLRKFREAYSK